MRVRGSAFFTAIILSISLSTSAQAAMDYKGYFGLQSGVAFPSTSSFVFSYGAVFSYRVRSWLHAGLNYQAFSLDANLVSGTQSADFTERTKILTAHAEYHFEGQLQGFNLGVKTGVVATSSSASATSNAANVNFSDSANYFTVGLKVGYDHWIGRLSVGGEASSLYSFVTGAPNVFSVLAVGKIWF